MTLQEFTKQCLERDSHWALHVGEMDKLFPKVTMTQEQFDLVYEKGVAPYMRGLGLHDESWRRISKTVWFDNLDDAVFFKLSLR